MAYIGPMRCVFLLTFWGLALGLAAQATPDTVCTLNCEHGLPVFSKPTTGGDGNGVAGYISRARRL